MTITSAVGSGGEIYVYNEAFQRVARIAASRGGGGCCGRIDVWKDGADPPKAILGVDTNERGILQLARSSENLRVQSNGVIVERDVQADEAKEAERKAFALLAADPETGGMFLLRSSDLKSSVSISPGEKESAGIVRISRGGPKVDMGILPTSNGVFRLYAGAGKGQLAAIGSGQIFAANGAGVEAMSLGVDGNDQGYFVANNRGGAQMSLLGVTVDGTGWAQVNKADGMSAGMGMMNGRGDVCSATACLSSLSILKPRH